VSEFEQVEKVSAALKELARNLSDLEQAGKGVPAVECNVLRMRGTLKMLEIQFGELEAVVTSA
jgi:hypothetical protein